MSDPRGFTLAIDWDPKKAWANLSKHGVGFRSASTALLDATAITIYDEDHSDDEERWVTLGYTTSGICVVVVHTWEQIGPDVADVRIISARHATKIEISNYWNNPQ